MSPISGLFSLLLYTFSNFADIVEVAGAQVFKHGDAFFQKIVFFAIIGLTVVDDAETGLVRIIR